MSSFVRTYFLKQQTPLIHFQYDQEGATLRATEVKPKLDRFIIAQMKKQGKPIPADWYIDKDDSGKAALNYKLRIFANDKPYVTQEKQSVGLTFQEKAEKRQRGELIHDLYFANQGSRPDQLASYKESVLFKRPLTLETTCFIQSLLDFIESQLPLFFAVTNFGTRQSKGFGGFSFLKNPNQVPSDDATVKLIQSYGKPFFFCKIDPRFDASKRRDIVLMNHAASVYAIMKGGINLTRYDSSRGTYRNPDGYIKGFIQRGYLDRLNQNTTGSDKAKIKKDVIPALPGHEDRYYTNYNHFLFVRAVLGLADHYEFRDDIRCIPSRNNRGFMVKNAHILNFQADELNEPGNMSDNASILNAVKKGIGIARFKSPITIKILSNTFVYIFEDSYDAILNKRFFLLTDQQKRDYDMGLRNQEFHKLVRILRESNYIMTPSSFDVSFFIRSFIPYFDREKTKLRKMQNTLHYYSSYHSNGHEFQLTIGGESRS